MTLTGTGIVAKQSLDKIVMWPQHLATTDCCVLSGSPQNPTHQDSYLTERPVVHELVLWHLLPTWHSPNKLRLLEVAGLTHVGKATLNGNDFEISSLSWLCSSWRNSSKIHLSRLFPRLNQLGGKHVLLLSLLLFHASWYLADLRTTSLFKSV